MYMDQVYQIRAIMEATGEVKDAPVIRELLDEALGARRRKAMGIADWEEPPSQGKDETLNTIQVLLLKLLKHEARSYIVRDIGLMMLREVFIEARACRDVAFEEIVRQPWLAKGKTSETMDNFFDMKRRNAIEYVDGAIKGIKKKAVDRQRKFEAEIDKELE